jgi:Flp pilus assembly protein CpaB
VALGLLAAGLMLFYLRSIEARTRGVGPTMSVVVARQEIDAGTMITPAMVELRTLPQTAVGGDAIGEIDQVTNRVARYPIARGEPIVGVRLVDPLGSRALSFQIPAGSRGFTIPVNQTRSPAALIAPGDFVDVIATVEGPLGDGNPPPSAGASSLPLPSFGDPRAPHGAITLLQNVQVLAVQRSLVEGVPYEPAARGVPPREATVNYLTLAVSPEQAQLLALAVERARTITVALRSFGDTETRPLSPIFESGSPAGATGRGAP